MDELSDSLPAPTPDEKTMATLAHVLQIVGWWIAPLIIYLIKRDSKFVSFHAMQALLWQLVWMVLWIVGACLWVFLIFATVFSHQGKPVPDQGLPPGFLLVFPLFWLPAMGFWLLNITIGIVYGIKASRGEWAPYPVIGRWARRIVG